MIEVYYLVGFDNVDFLFEFEVVVVVVGGEGCILIVDIGGGIFDFIVCDCVVGEIRIFVFEGICLGGINFDKDLSVVYVMLLLGYEVEIGNEMGFGSYIVLWLLFYDLVIWEKIVFVYGLFVVCEVG